MLDIRTGNAEGSPKRGPLRGGQCNVTCALAWEKPFPFPVGCAERVPRAWEPYVGLPSTRGWTGPPR
ncbi:Hypothetical predicted protein [Marmota monax]|uniref:Uncharacterized protein n=1 Tax=Marmota monax TaxID=9995 RepID=A0A5E4CLT8_MARMO|nr:Hypothetical predicted protein [Marmota monax]